MKAYVFCADIYCEDCGKDMVADHKREGTPDDGDSMKFPQGPFPEGGGEADTPQHCGGCGVFLGNPLTPDGVEYVRAKALALEGADVSGNLSWADIAGIAHDRGENALSEWIHFYLAWGS
jgi:hypothetical protein